MLTLRHRHTVYNNKQTKAKTMTNLTKYEVLDVTSWNGDTSTILKNHIYDTTTDISMCGRVNLAQWHLTCDGPAFTGVECKSCAKAYDKNQSSCSNRAGSRAGCRNCICKDYRTINRKQNTS